MREVVEQILENTYDYEKGSLRFSCEELEIELHRGEMYEGSFQIFSEERKYTKGYVFSSDLRMECLTGEFVGYEEEIAFRFHGEGLKEGDLSSGCFQIVSNQGEYTIPYVVTVVQSVPQSSMGPVANLVQFTSLAKSSWKEAVKIFYSSEFERMLQSGDGRNCLIYQGLSAMEGNEQNVEEFLIAVNKKQRIEFLVSEQKLTLDTPATMVELEINILRNGWGYTRLEVDTEGDFVFVEKNILTEDDFLGNSCKLPVYIDSSYLHGGMNLGAVTLKNTFTNLTVPVEVLVNLRSPAQKNTSPAHRKNMVELMELYLNFRLKKVSDIIWKKETAQILERMCADNEEDMAAELFRAQLLVASERHNEAEEILERIGDLQGRNMSPAMEAYWLYLSMLLKNDEAYDKEVARRIMKLYYDRGEDWKVAWIILLFNEGYMGNAGDKWQFLEKQFANGCRSPLIYVEAIQLLNWNPTLLRKLGSFELQVLNYANKQDVISAELLEQFIYLSGRIKEYCGMLLSILKGCYSKKPDSRILKEICTQLIKGNKTGKQCFEWFSKGIDEELRITNLYEYYMLSMDLDKEPEIPKRVLLYNTYQSNLDYLHSAYLYYYVTRNKEQFPEIFDTYSSRIERFVVDQIYKLHVNRHLAFLYHEFLREDMIDTAVAEALSYILFAYEIRFSQSGIRNVIVCQPDNNSELVYPVMNDEVWFPLYGETCEIFFEDLQGNRFTKDIACTIEKLEVPEQYRERVAQLTDTNTALDIYIYNSEKEGAVDEICLARYIRLLKCAAVAKKCKGEIIIKIAEYYNRAEDKKRLTEYLEELSMKQLSSAEAAEMIRYMVMNKQYETAYEWLKHFGDRNVDYKILLGLLETIIGQKEYAYEEELLDFSYRLFAKGSLNSTLLTYLMKYYQGLSKDMARLWNASKSYHMDKKAFCERVLVQIMFSGEVIGPREEIFKEYVYGGADRRIEDAYLTKNSYDYLVREQEITGDILTEIGRLHSVGESISTVCKLAYLKYYAAHQWEIQASDEPVVRGFLSDMLKEGIRLKCFQDLKQYNQNPLLLLDKTIVEYHTERDCTVKIHYRIVQEEDADSDAEYQTERMEAVSGRIFFKEFVLFWGESLQYYITEEAGGEEKVTENTSCHRGEEQDIGQDGRFGMINAMAYNKAMGDYGTFDHLVEDYYKKEFLSRAFFKLKR